MEAQKGTSQLDSPEETALWCSENKTIFIKLNPLMGTLKPQNNGPL